MVGIGVDDQRRARTQHRVDVFEDVRLVVDKQTAAVTAYARVLAGGVFFEPVPAEHIVLRPCHRARRDAGAQDRIARLDGFDVDVESAQLGGAGLAEHKRPADLCVVAVDAGREFGGHEIAGHEPAFPRRVHPAHFSPARAHDHEVLRAALGAIERLDIGAHLELRPPDPDRVHEDPIARRGHGGRTPNGIDFDAATC